MNVINLIVIIIIIPSLYLLIGSTVFIKLLHNKSNIEPNIPEDISSKKLYYINMITWPILLFRYLHCKYFT